MHYQWENDQEIQSRIRTKLAAILPVGAVEAHGPHLPLGTDNVLAEKLAERLAQRTDSYLLPTLPYGQVWSLRHFPGSLTVSNESLAMMLCDIGESLYRQGFRVLAIVNGHLGNAAALKEAARRLYDKAPRLKVFDFFYPGAGEVAARVRESPPVHGVYFHACEIETSYMLYLAGERVNMDCAPCHYPEWHAWADYTPTPWETFTSLAVLGDATRATREKGEAMLETSLNIMAEIVNRAKKEAAQAELTGG